MHIEISNCYGQLTINKIKIENFNLLMANQLKGKLENRITESRLIPLKPRVVAGDEGKSSF